MDEASGEPELPVRLRFAFSQEERAIHDRRVAQLDRSPFDLAVGLAPDEALIRARAHLRGRGSLADCARKSYTVKLDEPRHLFPDVRDDEFHLISMCEDEGYVQLHTASQILAGFDLYPFGYRFVELEIDHESAGVYLLIEKADHALLRARPEGDAVLRRRFDDGREWAEVAAARGDRDAPLDAWAAFLASLDGLTGRDLEVALERQIDLDQFLSWLALMSLLGNGDYVDELWIVAGGTRDGGPARWTFAGWDNDDLFSDCHYGGEFAFADRLSYCADGALEKHLLADPYVYRRYVDTLERVITELTPAALAAALDRTGGALLPYFERPEICAAMIELLEPAPPEPRDCGSAQREIRRQMERLERLFTSRRRQLIQRIADYRRAARSAHRTSR